MSSTDPPTPQSPRLERSAAKVLGANVAALVIGYVASILIARYLGPSSRGLLAAMQAGAIIAAVIGSVGVPVAANFLASRDPTARPALLGNGLVHAGLLTIVALGGAWLLQDELTERFAPGYDPSLWLGAALLVPITLLDYLLSSLMAASGAFGYRGQLIILGRLLSLLATLLFVVAIDGDVAGALSAVAIAQVVMILGGLRAFAASGSGCPARSCRRRSATGSRQPDRASEHRQRPLRPDRARGGRAALGGRATTRSRSSSPSSCC